MDPYQNRKWVVILTFFIIGITFSVRLLFLQVLDSKWQDRAIDITHAEKIISPSRGLIYDRNGNLIVEANQVYDIFLLPKKIKDGDSAKICKLLELTPEQYTLKLKKAIKYQKQAAPPPFIEGMHKNDYSKIAYKLELIESIKTIRNTQRGYPTHIAAHVLGYIAGISQKQYQKDQESEHPYYFSTDYIGISGLELIYEKELRGERGVLSFLQDKSGNKKQEIENQFAIAGYNLYATLDADLQAYGESLMHNKIGSIVAIEPSTGEILAMVSAPFYDPEMLVGRDLGKNYALINELDTLNLKPFVNKSIYNDTYRPGSIFKLVQALIAMQEGFITKNTGFACNKSLIHCHNHEAPHDVVTAIKHSCNPYFYQVYKRLIQRGENPSVFKDSRLGIEKWSKAVQSFGLGVKLNTDIPGIKTGNIPNANYYDTQFPNPKTPYGKHRWAFSTIYSNAIGEGEIGVSPLQMANLAAIIANRGYYYTPHLVKKIGEDGEKRPEYLVKNYTFVDSIHFEPVVNAMELVIQSGTARRAKIDSITICGKTGTVQNQNDTINDHSVFIAFAPKDNPKIAIAVYVEYGTWGGTWAAPIASLMVEKYLNHDLSEKGLKKEKRVLENAILTKNQVFR